MFLFSFNEELVICLITQFLPIQQCATFKLFFSSFSTLQEKSIVETFIDLINGRRENIPV